MVISVWHQTFIRDNKIGVSEQVEGIIRRPTCSIAQLFATKFCILDTGEPDMQDMISRLNFSKAYTSMCTNCTLNMNDIRSDVSRLKSYKRELKVVRICLLITSSMLRTIGSSMLHFCLSRLSYKVSMWDGLLRCRIIYPSRNDALLSCQIAQIVGGLRSDPCSARSLTVLSLERYIEKLRSCMRSAVWFQSQQLCEDLINGNEKAFTKSFRPILHYANKLYKF